MKVLMDEKIIASAHALDSGVVFFGENLRFKMRVQRRGSLRCFQTYIPHDKELRAHHVPADCSNRRPA
jgi:hypothetical protein